MPLFICGRSPVFPVKKAPELYFFQAADCAAAFVRTGILPLGTAEKRLRCSGLQDIFLELEQKGAANLNLVTGAHYVPQIISALEIARRKGLMLPVVYNSSGYENVETLRLLEGYVDVYLPDMKYANEKLAAAFSHAEDYPQKARAAIAEMVRQTGPCQFVEDGYIRRGTIVRHLILPGHTRNSLAVLKELHETYGNDIFISVMNQYTPVFKQEKYQELNRKVTRREYEKVLDGAIALGIENGYFQDGETPRRALFRRLIMKGYEKNLMR